MFKDFPILLDELHLTKRAKKNRFTVDNISKSVFSFATAEILSKIGGLVVSIKDRKATDPHDYKVFIDEMIEISQNEFTPELVETRWESDEQNKILIELRYQQRQYKTVAPFYKSTATLISPSVIHLANRILAECGNNNRFNTIFGVDESGGMRGVSVIFLSPLQREKILENQAFLIFSTDSEVNVWTENQVKATIQNLIELGLIPTLSDEEFEVLKENALQKRFNDAVSFLYEIPNLTYTFDTEYIDDSLKTENSYIEIITGISQLSGDIFYPTNLRVVITPPPSEHPDYDRKIELFFEFNGTTYSKELSDFQDWVDLSFIALINQSLSTNNIDYSFYGIDTGDQGAMIIFLDHERARKVKDSGLITLYHFT